MIRRVCIQLGGESKNQDGSPLKPDSLLPENYDVDWNAGTVWHQNDKLGSVVHRQPRLGDIKTMNAGWVDVAAFSKVTGANAGEVITALERELM